LQFDLEPVALTVRERTSSLLQFLVRLAGIVGGILVCSDYGFRTADFLVGHYFESAGPKTPLPGFVASPRPTGKTPLLQNMPSFSAFGSNTDR
jgi:hypothetical protein